MTAERWKLYVCPQCGKWSAITASVCLCVGAVEEIEAVRASALEAALEEARALRRAIETELEEYPPEIFDWAERLRSALVSGEPEEADGG